MTPEQAAAFIMAQAACALVELASMQATNAEDARTGRPPSYSGNDFMAIQNRYGIGHNDALSTFQNANR